ncbi:MAG: LuxR family transcriptional regulator [Pedosphaera sp.]|nr:LuxR family transcriptional regulator [Pedosphaera sp.]
MIRILIADDHAILRKGLIDTLKEDLGEVQFGEAENARQAIEQIHKGKWDLALVDIDMAGQSGLEALKEIRKSNPKLPVLIISMYPEAEFAVRAMKDGASGYVTKQSAPEELIVAVKKVLGGGRYVSPALAERLVNQLQRPAEQLPHERLSDRELQVLRMIATGRTQKEIAFELSLSIKTVSTYHARICEKMGMHSDVELARYALRNKVVS